MVSKCPATCDYPYVGHISVNSISPPHNHTSIMRCISKIEELDNTWQTQLFASISNKSPISEGHISILTSGFPGLRWRIRWPLSSCHSRRCSYKLLGVKVSWWLNRGAIIMLTCFLGLGWNKVDDDPSWLATSVGEILRTTNERARFQPNIRRGHESKSSDSII